MTSGKRPTRKPARRVLLAGALVAVVVAALAAELGVRITHPRADLAVLTGRAIGPSPMQRWAVVDAFAAYRGRAGYGAAGKSIDTHGFVATPSLARPKPAGTLRIVYLGGSAVAGFGGGVSLADEATWPWLATERLRRGLGRDVDHVNGALPGYTTFESIGRLWSRIRFFEPDIVVASHGWNDLYYFDDATRAHDWRTLDDGGWSLDRTDSPIVYVEPLAIDRLLAPSQLLTHLRLRLATTTGNVNLVRGEIGPAAGELDDSFDPAALEVWRTNLRLLDAVSSGIGAELLVVLQPTLVVADLPASERARCRYDYHGFGHEAHVEAYREMYRVIREEFAAERIIDLTSLSGRPELFADHVHPTREGAERIADLVAAGLLERLAR